MKIYFLLIVFLTKTPLPKISRVSNQTLQTKTRYSRKQGARLLLLSHRIGIILPFYFPKPINRMVGNSNTHIKVSRLSKGVAMNELANMFKVRISPPELFLGKGILKISSKLTE